MERMGFEKNRRLQRDFKNRSETAIIGGKTCSFRSQGEIRLANYLELLKVGGHIKDWAFEQTTFHFPDDKYLVDFDVLYPDGRFGYFEYKGMFDARSRRKLKLLMKYKPEVELTLVFGSKSDARRVSRPIANFCKRICVMTAKGLIDLDRTETIRK
jgi:hypothetical protein